MAVKLWVVLDRLSAPWNRRQMTAGEGTGQPRGSGALSRHTRTVAWCLLATCLAASRAYAADPAPVTLLTETDFVRKHYTFFPPRLSVRAATALNLDADPATRGKYFDRQYASGLETPPPPAG